METDIKINRKEVFRYLGYRETVPEERMQNLVEDVIAELHEICTPRITSKKMTVSRTEDGIACQECNLFLPGEDIRKHLAGCKEVIFMAATLGVEIEKCLHRYEVSDLLRATVMDAAASAMIEAVCERFVKEEEKNTEGFLTERFSPGYGDLPLTVQKEFLKVLDTARKIGLSCNESYLMIPRKSVSAIIGISPTPVGKRNRCETCRMQETCEMRKRGELCENNG